MFFGKKIYLSFFLISSALFMSCNDVIFNTIRTEVALEEASTSGEVGSIVRFDTENSKYLFMQNGGIYIKDISGTWNTGSTIASSAWFSVNKPGDYVYKVAADSNYLYAISATIRANDDEGENYIYARTVYCSSDLGVNWSPVYINKSSNSMLTLAGTSFTLNIFCTNAPQNDHRVAYANFNGTIYKLSGTTVTAVSTGGSDYSNVPTSNSASCAYFNGEVYFSSGYCMTTNENYTTDATHLYYAYASYIGYKNTSGETGVGYVGDVVYSLGITKDYIMVGTENGLQHGLLSGNAPALFTSEFTTNAESALSSYYEIWALLVVNPALSEISGDIYASTSYTGSSSSTSATFDNIGLWAYYPYRLEWNRE